MITRSVASMHYGEPRFTMDVDLVVHLDIPEIATIAATFSKPNYYTPPSEVIVFIGKNLVRAALPEAFEVCLA